MFSPSIIKKIKLTIFIDQMIAISSTPPPLLSPSPIIGKHKPQFLLMKIVAVTFHCCKKKNAQEKEETFIWAHDCRGFSPWLTDSVAMDLNHRNGSSKVTSQEEGDVGKPAHLVLVRSRESGKGRDKVCLLRDCSSCVPPLHSPLQLLVYHRSY